MILKKSASTKYFEKEVVDFYWISLFLSKIRGTDVIYLIDSIKYCANEVSHIYELFSTNILKFPRKRSKMQLRVNSLVTSKMVC